MKKKPEITEIEKAINKLTDKFEAWEILETLFEKSNAIDKERLKMDMIDLLTIYSSNFVMVKVDSMQTKSKLEDFVLNEIYPHYNDQRNQLFA